MLPSNNQSTLTNRHSAKLTPTAAAGASPAAAARSSRPVPIAPLSSSRRRPLRKWASNLDMYRKVPIDLLEGTKRGSVISMIAIMTMVSLFLVETISYLGSSYIRTDVALDLNKEQKVNINFNITMMDLKCDYVVIDVVSQMGTEQNVTSNIRKYSLDAKGVADRYKGRNKDQRDIILYDKNIKDSIEELHKNGEDAISLDPDTLEFAKEENTYLFVDFYASWCSHCRDLAPTWEILAEAMADAAMERVDQKLIHDHKHYNHKHPDDYTDQEYQEAMAVELPVMIAKIDCVTHKQLCFDQKIWAYPTLRLFVEGEAKADYHGDRTLLEIIHWLTLVEQSHKKFLGEDTFKVKVADQSKLTE
jgi:thiol-disulfide isomerase/thioredoxin